MTVHTQVLEARIAQLQTATQMLLSKQLAADSSETASLWRALDGLDAELWRALRQFDSLEGQRETLLAATSGAAPDQTAQQQLRVAAFDNDLGRLRVRAALLAARIVELRRRGGDASSADLAQSVCYLGAQMGKSLNQMMVRRTVYAASAQPLLAAGTSTPADAYNPVQALFVVIGMVSALVRGRSAPKA
jgi:hypothetical protein